jgi:hypothetical protein
LITEEQTKKKKWKRAHLFLAIGEGCNASVAILIRLLSVYNQWFGDQLVSCRDENRVSVILYLSLLFCVSIFLTKTCFLQGGNLGWCDVSVLDSVFFWVGCVFFALFFFWLIALFFSVFLLPSGAVGCSISGFLLFFFAPSPLIFGPFYRNPAACL